MSNHYPDEWSQRMHSDLWAIEKHLKDLKKINDIASAIYGAANDMSSGQDLRTVIKALANEIAAMARSVDYVERHVADGLRLPEAEQAEEEGT